MSATAAQPAPNTHPKDRLMRQDRLPHIWCPTCGIGTSVACFIEAIEETGIPEEKFAVVSGIGCTGRPDLATRENVYRARHTRGRFKIPLRLKVSRRSVDQFAFRNFLDFGLCIFYSLLQSLFLSHAIRTLDLRQQLITLLFYVVKFTC